MTLANINTEHTHNLHGAFLSGVEVQQQRHQGFGHLGIICTKKHKAQEISTI